MWSGGQCPGRVSGPPWVLRPLPCQETVMRHLDAQVCPVLGAEYSDNVPWVMGYLHSFGSGGHGERLAGDREGLGFGVESAQDSGNLHSPSHARGQSRKICPILPSLSWPCADLALASSQREPGSRSWALGQYMAAFCPTCGPAHYHTVEIKLEVPICTRISSKKK